MSDVLEKVRRLVALAGSPNENEARNAAAKACALIREHKLVLSSPSQAPTQARPSDAGSSPRSTSYSPGNPWGGFDEIMREVTRNMEAQRMCSLFGHAWVPGEKIEVTGQPVAFQLRCSRCGARAVGTPVGAK